MEQKRKDEDDKNMMVEDKRKIVIRLDANEDISRLTQNHFDMTYQLLGVNHEIGRKMEKKLLN